MQITDVIYRESPYNPGERIIGLKINGKDALIINEGQKSTWLGMGYVQVSPAPGSGVNWNTELQPISIPPDEEDGRGDIVLRGFVYSPELVALLRRMKRQLKNGTFEYGPVDFP